MFKRECELAQIVPMLDSMGLLAQNEEVSRSGGCFYDVMQRQFVKPSRFNSAYHSDTFSLFMMATELNYTTLCSFMNVPSFCRHMQSKVDPAEQFVCTY